MPRIGHFVGTFCWHVLLASCWTRRPVPARRT